MKLLFFLFILSNTTFANKSIPLKMMDVFIPSGFDSNDSSEIYVKGTLPDLCYQGPYYNLTIHNEDIFIDVYANNLFNIDNVNIPKFEVPYEINIPIGSLRAGQYRLILNKGTKYQKVSNLNINLPRSNQVDDYIYPIVKDINLIDNKLEIKTEIPSSCFQPNGVTVFSNFHGNTLSVLPRLKITSNYCPSKVIDYTYVYPLKSRIMTDTLIHARSMGGKSFNKIVKSE